jgi:hypothetical protein
MNYIGALAVEGKPSTTARTSACTAPSSRSSSRTRRTRIKLTSLVSNVVDKETQEKIDVVKQRLIRNYGYNDESATDVLNFVASIFARGDAKRICCAPALFSLAGRSTASVPPSRRALGPPEPALPCLRIDRTTAASGDRPRQDRQNLKKYISKGELIGKQGKDVVSIPLPQIDLPRFKFGEKTRAASARATANPATASGSGNRQPGQARRRPARARATRSSRSTSPSTSSPRSSVKSSSCPASSRRAEAGGHRARPLHRAFVPSGPSRSATSSAPSSRRSSAASPWGTYDPANPVIVPIREDMRYRTWSTVSSPQSNAVVIYMMDVSGSMGDEQKEIVRIESFWIERLAAQPIRRHRDALHHPRRLGPRGGPHTFFHTRESGGTMISSAYKLCAEIIEDDYPSADWNIYPFHFSDGDNWSVDDTGTASAS